MTASGEQWKDEAVSVVDYDPAWPGLFAAEAALLEAAIGQWITGGIHHVGSTAVPGLAAKPVIDILVGVDGLDVSRSCIDRVAPLHYVYAPYRTEEMHWFCKPSPSHRTHHLHIVPTGSQRFADELAFRDYLRAHDDRARAYAAVKQELARRHRHDREAYTEEKGAFVLETLVLAGRRP
ncbi:MAG: hypothetical protein B7C55_08125 [Actinomycetales bacterium mxb001]|nr:MAG: hypothetical protein B7C55_08125 [Actinomycetales bacterium mxb001]